jgi:hypothetical protein
MHNPPRHPNCTSKITDNERINREWLKIAKTKAERQTRSAQGCFAGGYIVYPSLTIWFYLADVFGVSPDYLAGSGVEKHWRQIAFDMR